MNKLYFLFFAILFFSICHSQSPGVRWSKTYATNPSSMYYDLKSTGDKGYIAVGFDSEGWYDKYYVLKRTLGRIGWIVKIDSVGNTQWYKQKWNSGDAFPYHSVVVASDGGYVAAGMYEKGFAPPFDSANFYLVKFDAVGNTVWEKSYGGTRTDIAYSISKTSSGGYIVAGHTNSNDGDVTGNHGTGADVWLIKTNVAGNLTWKKCFGGSGRDTAYKVIETSDKGYVVAASSTSSDGNLTGNNGATDAWLFKTDSSGNLVWQKNYGGSSHDVFHDVVENADGTFTVTGYTTSSGVTSNGFKGSTDLWVTKVSSTGNIIWSMGYGGPSYESGNSISRLQDGTWIVGGYTESISGDVSGNNGAADAWLVKINSSGGLIWQKCAGTNRDELALTAIALSDDDFIVSGLSQLPQPDITTRGYIARLGNTAHFRADLIYPVSVTGGLLQLNGTGFQYSAVATGVRVSVDVDTGNYVATFTSPNNYYNVTPPSINLSFLNYTDTITSTFTIQPILGKRDLTINAIPLSAARPGFPVSYKILYKNVGTDTVAAGQVLFKRDTRLNFISANPGASAVSGDTLKWNFSDFHPFDSGSIVINLQVQPPPSVNINDTISSIATINPVIGDLTPADDTALIRQRVIGSFDPNDKGENFAGSITPAQIASGTYINYLIRFQNTGTDTAFNVVIRDTLDSKLDWASLQIVGASHANSLQITGQNNLAWYFDNIRLPDSNRNQAASHGYVAYRIKPKSTLVPGEFISNSASIYFDFNLPVRTNTQVTTVSNNIITGINNLVIDQSSMLLFPNPGPAQIWLRIPGRIKGDASLQLLDFTGKLVFQEKLGRIDQSNFQKSIDCEKLVAGSYIVSLRVGKTVYVQKLIIQ